jgi:hypothetical protein
MKAYLSFMNDDEKTQGLIRSHSINIPEGADTFLYYFDVSPVDSDARIIPIPRPRKRVKKCRYAYSTGFHGSVSVHGYATDEEFKQSIPKSNLMWFHRLLETEMEVEE